MACHTPHLKKAKKQGEMPLPILSPIPSLNSTFYEWDGTEEGNGIMKIFNSDEKSFFFLVCS